MWTFDKSENKIKYHILLKLDKIVKSNKNSEKNRKLNKIQQNLKIGKNKKKPTSKYENKAKKKIRQN